jgi:hypothetical protein
MLQVKQNLGTDCDSHTYVQYLGSLLINSKYLRYLIGNLLVKK